MPMPAGGYRCVWTTARSTSRITSATKSVSGGEGELRLHRAASDQRGGRALLQDPEGADRPRQDLSHGGRGARRRRHVRQPLQRPVATREERLHQPITDPRSVVRPAGSGGRRVRQIPVQESACGTRDKLSPTSLMLSVIQSSQIILHGRHGKNLKGECI